MSIGGSMMVNTVTGPVLAEQLGVTLSHEHLALNPGNPSKYQDEILDDIGRIIPEATSFRQAGGGTIVDMTPLNFGRDVRTCREVSKATGVLVICATGFHKEEFLPAWVRTNNDAQVEELLRGEIEDGIADTTIRAGVIKVGTSFDTITSLESRMISIAARVQRRTRVPVSTHCDKGTMGMQQAELFLKHGVRPERVILGHVDIPNDAEYLKKICALGFNVQIDHVGRNLAQHDGVKINLLKTLINSGYIEQVFLSGDMGKRSYLKSYGGRPGLDYIPREFAGYLLANQITTEQIEQILVTNPRRVFGIPAEGNPPAEFS